MPNDKVNGTDVRDQMWIENAQKDVVLIILGPEYLVLIAYLLICW